jgi:hypothetical protein
VPVFIQGFCFAKTLYKYRSLWSHEVALTANDILVAIGGNGCVAAVFLILESPQINFEA